MLNLNNNFKIIKVNSKIFSYYKIMRVAVTLKLHSIKKYQK